MKYLLQFRRAVDRFFFREDPRSEFLVFFRVGVGVVALLHFLSTLLDFDRLFTSKSIIPQDIIGIFTPEWMISFPMVVHFLEGMGIPETATVTAAKALYIALCLLIMVGFYSRWSALLLLFLQISITKGGSFFIYGVDFFTSMSLFYVFLFPSDHYFSLRKTLSKRPWKPANFTPVKRMFQIHLSIAYFFSGFDKVLGFNWHNGEAIWKAINLPYANRDFVFDFSWLAAHPWILVTIGWATILVEMLYPVFIWIPATRRFWLWSTVAMHLSIALVLNLYYFSAVMIVWNLSNFYFETQAVDVTKREARMEAAVAG